MASTGLRSQPVRPLVGWVTGRQPDRVHPVGAHRYVVRQYPDIKVNDHGDRPQRMTSRRPGRGSPSFRPDDRTTRRHKAGAPILPAMASGTGVDSCRTPDTGSCWPVRRLGSTLSPPTMQAAACYGASPGPRARSRIEAREGCSLRGRIVHFAMPRSVPHWPIRTAWPVPRVRPSVPAPREVQQFRPRRRPSGDESHKDFSAVDTARPHRVCLGSPSGRTLMGLIWSSLAELPDPRTGNARRRNLLETSTIALTASVSSAESCVDLTAFVRDR